MDWKSCSTFALATQKNGASEVSEPYEWWSSFVGERDAGRTYYIIGVRRMSEVLEKKNFSENLVVSKSCRTFALATPKKGWSEVSDT